VYFSTPSIIDHQVALLVTRETFEWAPNTESNPELFPENETTGTFDEWETWPAGFAPICQACAPDE
jgi:hypothetical protein